MKEIKLTQRYTAQVSDRDYARVNQYKWCAQVDRRNDESIKNVYAIRTVRREKDGTRTAQFLHRFIIGVTDPKVQVDHSPDHSGLNCTRENLRLANHAENNHNQRLRVDSTSGVKGVCWDKNKKKWQASICVNSKRKHLGLFKSLEEAKQAYDTAALKYYGTFACTNAMLQGTTSARNA